MRPVGVARAEAVVRPYQGDLWNVVMLMHEDDGGSKQRDMKKMEKM